MGTKDLLNMYNCFVLPYLLYCLPLWGGSVNTKDDIIVKTQNKILRILFKTKRSERAWELADQTIVPIKVLYKLEIAKFCYKHSKGILPKRFYESIMPCFVSDKRNLNTRQSENKNYHIKIDDFLPLTAKSFHVNCIKLWNDFPLSIKHQTNIHKFLEELSKYYFLTNQ